MGHTIVNAVDDAHDTTHNFIFKVKFQFPRFCIHRLPYIGHICETFFIWPEYYIYAHMAAPCQAVASGPRENREFFGP